MNNKKHPLKASKPQAKKARLHPDIWQGDEEEYQAAIKSLRSKRYELVGMPTEDFNSYRDIVDADGIATAYGQIAEALEILEEVGVPFSSLRARLEGRDPFTCRHKRSNAGRSR